MSKFIKYIDISEQFPKRLTETWQVCNAISGTIIGYIAFYPGWRKYVFGPPNGVNNVIFDADCLMDIAIKLNNMNFKRKLLLSDATDK